MEEEKIIPIDTRTKWSGWGMVAGIVIGMALTGSMAAAVYFYTKTKQQEQVLPLPSPTTIPTVRPQPTQEDMGVRWVSPPVEISKLDIFRAKDDRPDVPDYITDGAKFYKVAELDNGATLIDVTIQYGMMDSVVRLIERKDMTYEYLAAYLDKGVEEDSKRALKPGVTASNRRFDGLETPEELTMEEKTYKKGFLSYISFESLKNPVAMTDNLYRVETKILDSNQIFARVIYLRLKDGVVVPYSLKNTAYPDDQKPYLEWTDGVSGNKMAFRQAVTVSCSAGMGSSVPIIKEGSPLLSTMGVAGKWQGQTIYQIKDTNNELVKKLYDSYKVGRDYPSAAPVVSIEEFVNQKSHFL